MNTIRIYLTESGRIADLQKDFPLYQGQFQNKLLNVFVPTSILAPIFTSSGAVSADYVASTSTKIGMTYTARDGSIKVSKNYYMRYLKTLMYKGVEYALYERKLPKEFTFYAGQGENSPVLIINVVNIEQQSGDTPPLVLSVITSQTCHLDVMQSTFLDRDELDEPSELENLNAQVQALNAIMPLKQDKEDENINLEQKPAQKTVVGAINDLGGLVKTAQSSADTAQQTAETAQTTADNAITLANNAVATANGAVATANEAKTTAQTAENNANSAVDKANDAVGKANEAIMKADAKATSIGFMTAKDAVTALNGYPRTQLKGGDTIWIVEDGTPDLWVTDVAQESVPYNYTTKDKFNQDLVDNKVLQIGYFKTAYQESDGKPVTIAWQNVLVKSTDWVASTEFADFPYEAKIELTDFVDYTTVPQVVFDIADTMSGNYAPICKSGDKCVYIYGKVQDEITLKTVITFAPNVNGASVTGGGYNNRGKWVASTTYAIDDLVYTDNGQFVCIEGITSTTSPEQDTQHWQATFVATGKTKNTLTISGQDNGTGVQKTFDGSTAVEIAFDENTMTAKEVDGVLKVGAKGTVPEALPQEASALKSGELPTSGWTAEAANIVTTTATIPYNSDTTVAYIDADIAKLKTGWEITLTGDNQEYSGTYYNQYSSGQNRIVYKFDFEGGNHLYELTDKFGNTRFSLKIYKNGEIKMSAAIRAAEGTYAIGIKNTAYSQWTYTISDTSITANSDILMELTDEGGVKAYAMEAGKIMVIRDTVPTQPIPYTYKVKQTNASGQFTLVNHFVPSIPESPTSLPVTYKKVSGSLPTTGWTSVDAPLWTGAQGNTYDSVVLFNLGVTWESPDVMPLTGWTFSYHPKNHPESISTISSDWQRSGNGVRKYFSGTDFSLHVAYNGDVTFTTNSLNLGSNYYILTEITQAAFSKQGYTISDADITANTSVKMYLTDDGGVKAHSKAAGSIQVIRDTVPTTAIPYEYEVEQTSDEGLFEVINAYVPAVPTKTSQLTNDSGFITSADIPSAGEWVTVTENSATLTEAGTYQVLFGENYGVQSIIYWDGSTGANGIPSTTASVTSSGTAVIAERYLTVEANGVLSTHITMITVKDGSWTQTTPSFSGFKYRKIN